MTTNSSKPVKVNMQEVVDLAESSSVEAMETLLGDVPVSIEDREQGISHTPESQVASIVTLSGQISGLISLHASEALAGHIARVLLGTDKVEDLSEDEIKKAFAELCNIVAGNIRNQCLEVLKLDIELGPPITILPKNGIAIPPPAPGVTAAIIHAKLAFCPISIYLCLADQTQHG